MQPAPWRLQRTAAAFWSMLGCASKPPPRKVQGPAALMRPATHSGKGHAALLPSSKRPSERTVCTHVTKVE